MNAREKERAMVRGVCIVFSNNCGLRWLQKWHSNFFSSFLFFLSVSLWETFRLNFDIECQWMMVWNFVFSEWQCWMPFYWCFCRNNLTNEESFPLLEFVKFNFEGERKQCLKMQCFAFVFPLKNLYQNVNVIVSL